MLSINDIVALAKQGYKPADVKELIEMSKEDDKKPENSVSIPSPLLDDVPSETGAAIVAPAAPEPSEPKKDKEPEPDYKALYEKTKIDLDKAQKENIKKDISDRYDDEKSDDDILKDLFKQFM